MTTNIKELQQKIEELEAKLETFELNPDDYIDQYEAMLDECYGEFMNMSASHILKSTDQTAYHCALLDYIDGLDKEDDAGYQKIAEELEDLKSELEELEEAAENE